MRNDKFDKAFSVEYRDLDSEPWHIAGFDYDDGTYVIRRGAPASINTNAPSGKDVTELFGGTINGSDRAIADDLEKILQRADLTPTTRHDGQAGARGLQAQCRDTRTCIKLARGAIAKDPIPAADYQWINVIA
jgi:hypothetical protein